MKIKTFQFLKLIKTEFLVSIRLGKYVFFVLYIPELTKKINILSNIVKKLYLARAIQIDQNRNRLIPIIQTIIQEIVLRGTKDNEPL